MIVRLVVHLMLQQLEAVATAKIVCQISLQTSQPRHLAKNVETRVLQVVEQQFAKNAMLDCTCLISGLETGRSAGYVTTEQCLHMERHSVRCVGLESIQTQRECFVTFATLVFGAITRIKCLIRRAGSVDQVHTQLHVVLEVLMNVFHAPQVHTRLFRGQHLVKCVCFARLMNTKKYQVLYLAKVVQLGSPHQKEDPQTVWRAKLGSS